MPNEETNTNKHGKSNNMRAESRRYFLHEIQFNIRYDGNMKRMVPLWELTSDMKATTLHSFFLISLQPLRIPEFALIGKPERRITVTVEFKHELIVNNNELTHIIEV
jgi:hypothetical protein